MSSPTTAPLVISYSHIDELTALKLCHSLEQNGLRCWIASRDIQPGKTWPGEITKAIAGCRAVLLVFSKNADSSSEIPNEVRLAKDYKKVLIPVKIEPVTVTNWDLQYLIKLPQWVDLFVDWQDGVRRICSELERVSDVSIVAVGDNNLPGLGAHAGSSVLRWHASSRTWVLGALIAAALGLCAASFTTSVLDALLSAESGAVQTVVRWIGPKIDPHPTPDIPPAQPTNSQPPNLPTNANVSLNAVTNRVQGRLHKGSWNSPNTERVEPGTQVHIVEELHDQQSGGWARIDEPTTGWLPKAMVMPLEPPSGYKTNAITVVKARVHQSPNAESPDVDQSGLAANIPVHVVAESESGGWAKIDQPKRGWIIKWAYRQEIGN